MNVTVNIDNVSGDEAPEPDSMQIWVEAAIGGHWLKAKTEAELNIRIVDDAEAAKFNKQYRDQAGATNVLSFPADLPPIVASPLLGDLVICAPLVLAEAREQGKQTQAHWAHLIIHGTLHLLGYDHIDEDEAAHMEAIETDILSALSFPPPYASDTGCDDLTLHAADSGNENQHP